MNTMFTFVYDKENGHQQDNSWYVYIHWKCFEETAKITILSELSYFTIIEFRILFSYMCHG